MRIDNQSFSSALPFCTVLEHPDQTLIVGVPAVTQCDERDDFVNELAHVISSSILPFR
jgi:hypothetical protein